MITSQMCQNMNRKKSYIFNFTLNCEGVSKKNVFDKKKPFSKVDSYIKLFQEQRKTTKVTERSATPAQNIPQVTLSHFFTLANVSLQQGDEAPLLQKTMRNSP